jgi:glutamyl-tRNA synthetase
MFHVGNARSALFNWVVAKQAGGVTVLRIEDTDAERNTQAGVDSILEAMAWLGMGPGEYEGPYFQFANARHHREAITELYAKDLAYRCDCTRVGVNAAAAVGGART